MPFTCLNMRARTTDLNAELVCKRGFAALVIPVSARLVTVILLRSKAAVQGDACGLLGAHCHQLWSQCSWVAVAAISLFGRGVKNGLSEVVGGCNGEYGVCAYN